MTIIAAAAATRVMSQQHAAAAVIGGSLGGLAAAHALQQSGVFAVVDVFERSPAPLSTKGSGLGYVNVPAWESLARRPMMRRGRRASRHQGSFYYGDLWKFLYEPLVLHNNNNNNNNDQSITTPTVNIHFNSSIDHIDGTVNQPVILGKPYDLVVVANGGFSQLRNYVLEEESNNSQQEPEYAGYVVWRGSVDTRQLDSILLQELQNIEGVYKSGIYDTIVLKMAKDDGTDLWTMGTFVATPEEETKQYWNKQVDGKSRHGGIDDNDDTNSKKNQQNATPDWFLPHMRRHFGNVPGLMTLMESIVQKGELKAHPQYEFGNIDRVHNGRILLLGDAAHMASPRTAVGAHTAIMDALALRDAFQLQHDHDGGNNQDQTCSNSNDIDIDARIERYSKTGLLNARGLYARTREVSAEFVPPGGLDAIQSPASAFLSQSPLEESSSL